MRWHFIVVVASLLAVTACGNRVLSPRDETVRTLGCKARDVTITSYGENGSERSWTAACGRQRYTCSKLGADRTTYAACTPALSAEGSWRPAAARPQPPLGRPNIPFPKSAGGFVFGDSAADVAKACQSSGHAWTQTDATRASCDGTATDVGWPAHASFEFCDAKLCTLSLSAPVQGDDVDAWLRSHRELAESFAKLYGAPAPITDIPSACWGDAVRSCYLEGRAREIAAWGWASGETFLIQLSGEASGAKGPALALLFRAPRTAAGAQLATADPQAENRALIRAKALFSEGIAAFEAGRTEEALEDFQRSRTSYPSSKNTLNIAVCLHRLQRIDEALDAYDDVLETYGAELEEHERATITSAAAALKPRVGTLAISANVAATVVIDGRQRGSLPLGRPVSVAVGARHVLLLKESYAPFERTVVVKAGSLVKLDAGLSLVSQAPQAGR